MEIKVWNEETEKQEEAIYIALVEELKPCLIHVDKERYIGKSLLLALCTRSANQDDNGKILRYKGIPEDIGLPLDGTGRLMLTGDDPLMIELEELRTKVEELEGVIERGKETVEQGLASAREAHGLTETVEELRENLASIARLINRAKTKGKADE